MQTPIGESARTAAGFGMRDRARELRGYRNQKCFAIFGKLLHCAPLYDQHA